MRGGPAITLSDLYLAFRQAKTALYFERRGVGLHELAQYEQDLGNQLRLLKETLDAHPWFDGLEIGEPWVVPKRFREQPPTSDGIIRIGVRQDKAARPIDVQVRVSPTPQFAIVEILYLWQFGGNLDALLPSPEVLGYRLDLREQKVVPDRRWVFEFWPPRYQEFRTAPLNAARDALQLNRKVMIISADLASFYDTVDPTFLLSKGFIRQLRDVSVDKFAVEAYEVATTSLLNAFRRFQAQASGRIGIPVTTGVPIGALTSRLVANLALESLDRHIAGRPGVLCYRRYVDDMVIVARERSADKAESLLNVLRTFLPIKSTIDDTVRLDCDELSRPGCDFRLQSKKVRVHHLAGTPGTDFVDAVASDFASLVSERRAFVDIATLHGEGAGHLIRARQQAGSPLRVLRQADRAKLERYALSTSLHSLERISSLVDGQEARAMVRNSLDQVARVLDAEDNWLEDLDVSLRLFKLAVVASDWKTAAEINQRMDAVWGSVESLREAASALYFLGQELPRGKRYGWTSLRDYLHERRAEAMAAVLPRMSKGLNDLEARFKGGLKYRARHMSMSVLKRRAAILAASDLRSRDREEDSPKGARPPAVDRTWLIEELSGSGALVERLTEIGRFVARCEDLNDPPWMLAPARLFLCIRPPSYFDIARRWLIRVESDGFRSDIFQDLLDVVNAIRGTRYADPVGTVIDPSNVWINSFWQRPAGGSPMTGPRVMLGNLVVKNKAWEAAAKRTLKPPYNKPHMTLERLRGLATVLEKANRVAQNHPAAVLVLPELSIPRDWFRALSNYVVLTGRYGLVAGLEYRHDPASAHVSNEVHAVIPGPSRSVASWSWTKRRPAREEATQLAAMPVSVTFAPPKGNLPRIVVSSPWGSLSVLICSEMIEARRVADLVGRVDVVLCPAWNPDTSSYDHLIQSAGFQLHAVIAIANNGHYSDCRAWAPRAIRWERDLCRLVERGADDLVHVDLPLESLRAFHADPTANEDWRPLPPDWR